MHFIYQINKLKNTNNCNNINAQNQMPEFDGALYNNIVDVFVTGIVCLFSRIIITTKPTHSGIQNLF